MFWTGLCKSAKRTQLSSYCRSLFPFQLLLLAHCFFPRAVSPSATMAGVYPGKKEILFLSSSPSQPSSWIFGAWAVLAYGIIRADAPTGQRSWNTGSETLLIIIEQLRLKDGKCRMTGEGIWSQGGQVWGGSSPWQLRLPLAGESIHLSLVEATLKSKVDA